jgi:hypothetical protein
MPPPSPSAATSTTLPAIETTPSPIATDSLAPRAPARGSWSTTSDRIHAANRDRLSVIICSNEETAEVILDRADAVPDTAIDGSLAALPPSTGSAGMIAASLLTQ